MKNLFEYGEKKIINELIYATFPHLKFLHGDAVNVPISKYTSFSFSTDPCPEPIVSYFDKGNKYYYYGYLSVVINYSDLAACGSEPIGILLSTVMPNEMLDSEYQQFLDGVKDACANWGGKILGGNIKDGKSFSVTGTSIGGHSKGSVLSRRGMNEGDVICTVGDLGMFWLAIFQLMEGKILGELDEYEKSFLLSPRPKILEGRILAESEVVTSCMDNSDGVIGCLYELAEINNLTIHIEDEKFVPNPNIHYYCKQKNIDYRNFLFSFGGWELVFSCSPNDVSILQKMFSKCHSSFRVIGYSSRFSNQYVVFHKEGKTYRVQDVSSKRFNKDSYFTFGLDSFLQHFYNNNFVEIT